jgi:hypothetical protein
MGLAEFLAARLADDEAGANEVHKPGNCICVADVCGFSEDPLDCSCGYPARVLREVEAKRKILAEAQAVRKLLDLTGGEHDQYRDWVLRQFAAIYEGHPDFDPSWKD